MIYCVTLVSSSFTKSDAPFFELVWYILLLIKKSVKAIGLFYNIVTVKEIDNSRRVDSYFPICYFFHLYLLPKVSSISMSMWPMSFSSNGTSSLCGKVEDEVMGSSHTGCMCNLLIKKIDI
jgi:hypothetical protein